MTGLVNSPKLYFLYAMSKKDVSNLALCATIGKSLKNSINLFTASSSVALSCNISSVILVISVIFVGSFLPGLINSSYFSIITPSFILTAPISIIWSPPPALNPVVSKSNTTYSSSNNTLSVGLTTISTLSSIIVNSAPYITLNLSFSSLSLLYLVT